MPANDRLYITDMTHNQLVVVNRQDGKNQDYFPISTTEDYVNSVVVTPDQKTAYVATMGDGSIFKIDLFGGASPEKIAFSSGGKVNSIVLDSGRNYLYAGGASGLYRIDLDTHQATLMGDGSVNLQGYGIKSLEIGSDNNTLYGQYEKHFGGKGVFRCALDSTEKLVLSPAITSDQLGWIAKANATGLALDEANGQLWVSYVGHLGQGLDYRVSQVLSFDLATVSYRGTVNVGLQPSSISMNEAGDTLYVLKEDGTVATVRTSNGDCNQSAIRLTKLPNIDPSSFRFFKMFREGSILFFPDHASGRLLSYETEGDGAAKLIQVPATACPLVFREVGLVSGTAGLYPAPEVDLVFPIRCAVGSTLTITGKGFTSSAEEIEVQFSGGVSAVPTASTLTQLTVTVPTGAVTGDLTVTYSGNVSAPNGSITVLTQNEIDQLPKVTSFKPTNVVPGMWLELVGENFTQGGKVIFQGATPAEAVFDPRSTPTTAFVQVPVDAISGTFTVECDSEVSDPSPGRLGISTPPLIEAKTVSVSAPAAETEVFAMATEAIELGASASPNTLNIKQVTAAESKDESTFKGFVGVTEQKSVLKFVLDGTGSSPVVEVGGGQWLQGGSFPSAPGMTAITSICHPSASDVDAGSTTPIVAVGSTGNDSGVNYASTSNPIVYSTDGGSSWSAPSSITTQAAAANPVNKVAYYAAVAQAAGSSSTNTNGLFAVGVGYRHNDSKQNQKITFYTKGQSYISDPASPVAPGAAWAAGIPMFDGEVSAPCFIVSGNKATYFISPATSSSNQSIVQCYKNEGGLMADTPVNIPFPSVAGYRFELTGATCNGSTLVFSFTGSQGNDSQRTIYYRFVTVEIDESGDLVTSTAATYPTNETDPLYNLAGNTWYPISIAYNEHADVQKYLAVTTNGAIYSSSDAEEWTLVKPAATAPIFHKSTTGAFVNLNVQDRSFFISGVWTGSSVASTVIVTY